MQPLPTLNIIKTRGLSIVEQLTLEEALLRADQRNWFIWNEGSPPAVVLGISGSIQELIDRTVWEANPFPLIRRFSGGGTVVVDENTLFASWIMNHDALPHVPPLPSGMLHWVGTLLHPLEIHISEQDFVHNTRKVGGNAQYLRKDRWLHHTSFLWDYLSEHMRVLKMPAKCPAYRENRDHTAFCQPLKEHLSSPHQLLENLLCGMQKEFILQYVSLEEACKVLAFSHRKTVRTESWPK